MFKMLLGIQIITLLWLMIGSVIDFIHKKIPKWYAFGTILLGVIVGTFCVNGEWWNHFIGGGIGLIFFLIARLTKEQIGYGDAYILTGVGVAIGAEQMIWVLIYTFTSLFLVSMVIVMRKKVNCKTTIAFIPFLFVGYCITFIKGGIL